MRVLVVDGIAPEGPAYLRERGFQVDELIKPSPDTLHARLPDYDALITRSGTAVTPDLLKHAPRLRIVGRAGVGVDNIDVDACSRRGIVVVNAPYGNVVSAAEHTVGVLLALVRRIPEAHGSLKALTWDRSIYGAELFRKTVGVVGLGKVGSRVAARLRAFETELLVYDPYVAEARAREVGARLIDFETLLRESDVITFHVPLTEETTNMVTARELGLMKRGVRLVNCARGGVIHEADLLVALESGHVAGAAIDVWSEEPPQSERLRRLVAHPRVVVTPHLGANSGEAQVNVALDVARQLVAFRDGDLVEYAVNIPVGDSAVLAELKPFIGLADRLGRFCVQLDPEHLASVEVAVAGAVAQTDPELLARAVLAGLLGPVMAGPVNLVNAHLVARERGVDVRVSREGETHGYNSLVTVTTQTREGRKIIAGTVFDGQPRIVRLRDLNIEFTPEGHILVLSYEDRPGMVGRIGTTLGNLGINIASMHVGRRSKRGRAIVVLILDEELTPSQVGGVARAVEADFARFIRLT
ncbi:MAG: phosphoglycerate dehydrogenase [Candidatus Rokubacteria bacterium 13_1_40CM_4_69_5]|nr:MAG: phosphoglycerate dehydrogenase [Candidatus Rokubacteria bacterium 13_1_40CM_4_69_5]